MIIASLTGLSCGVDAALWTVAAIVFFLYCVAKPEKQD